MDSVLWLEWTLDGCNWRAYGPGIVGPLAPVDQLLVLRKRLCVGLGNPVRSIPECDSISEHNSSRSRLAKNRY